MEQEYHSELFDIRCVSENDKELFREVAKAEYLFGRLYDVEPDIGLKVYWESVTEDDTEINNGIGVVKCTITIIMVFLIKKT